MDFGAAGGGGLPIMTAGPCVSLAKIRPIPEKPSSAALLGGLRRCVRHEVAQYERTRRLEDRLMSMV